MEMGEDGQGNGMSDFTMASVAQNLIASMETLQLVQVHMPGAIRY